MILIDTGPLVALVDKADNAHQKILAAFQSLTSAPLTTLPCLTEAFYLIGEIAGWNGQKTLFALLMSGAIEIHASTDSEMKRIGELMEQYNDKPMDFADASLVALAETFNIKTIITLDSDFYIYKIHGKDAFDVVAIIP